VEVGGERGEGEAAPTLPSGKDNDEEIRGWVVGGSERRGERQRRDIKYGRGRSGREGATVKRRKRVEKWKKRIASGLLKGGITGTEEKKDRQGGFDGDLEEIQSRFN
jgi:hypothetical protein